MNNSDHNALTGTVVLSANNGEKTTVLEFSVPLDSYYSESHPLIDDDGYRRENSIRFICGRIYDYDGSLDQEFKNEYSSDGAYIRSTVTHADGTVIED